MSCVRSDRGAVLIIVVGIAMLLLAMTTAFVARIRSDVEAARVLVGEAQTRTLIAAACAYVLETGRIGWGEEAYGWCDIRDDSDPAALPGPRGRDGRQLPKRHDGSWAVDPAAAPLLRWPAIGGIARCPMFLPTLPPYATKGQYAYNPVPRRSYSLAEPDASGYPSTWSIGVRYNALSPQPAAFPNPEPAGPWRWDDAASGIPGGYAEVSTAFAAGGRVVNTDPGSLQGLAGTQLGWFRVLRIGVDVFVVSAGSGASRGFRTWQEVVESGAQAIFYNDPALFRSASASDRPLWYEIQWSSSVGGRGTGQYAAQSVISDLGKDHTNSDVFQILAPPHLGYELIPHGLPSGVTYPDVLSRDMPLHNSLSFKSRSSSPHQGVNQLGTLSQIRRLFAEPALW